MDFRRAVLDGANEKHRKMLTNMAGSPFEHAPGAVGDLNTYKRRAEAYTSRLQREKKDFNEALTKIKDQRAVRIRREEEAARLREEQLREKRFATVQWVITAVIAAPMLLWAFVNLYYFFACVSVGDVIDALELMAQKSVPAFMNWTTLHPFIGMFVQGLVSFLLYAATVGKYSVKHKKYANTRLFIMLLLSAFPFAIGILVNIV